MKSIKSISVTKTFEDKYILIIRVKGTLDDEHMREVGESLCGDGIGFTATVDENMTELVFVTNSIENAFESVSGWLKWHD